MVSTRNANLSAPPPNAQPKSKQRNTATRSVTAESARPQTKDLASNDVPSIGEPRLRKRGRNESDTGDTAPPPSGLSGGSRSPNAKRAKAQASAEGTDAIPQAAGLSSSENFYPNLGPSDLAGHSEPIDSQYGPENDGHVSVEGSNDPFSQGLGLRTQSLPVLDNFATQILSIIAKSSHQEVSNMMAAPQTGAGQQWSLLVTLFMETKKVYDDKFPFLSAQSLGLSGKTQIDTVKKANLATFVCSLFGGREDIGFEHLDAWFLDTFSIDGTRLLKPQTQLFVDLKTQAYISAVSSGKDAIVNGQRNSLDILKALFPPDLDQHLLHRRSEPSQLNGAERQFIEQAQVRSDSLLGESQSEEGIDRLPSQYPWETFLSAIQSYVKSNLNELMGKHTPVVRRPGRPRQEQNVFRAAYANQALYSQGSAGQRDQQLQSTPSSSNDIAEKAARAAHFVMESVGNGGRPQDGQSPQQQQRQTSQASGPPIQFHFERPLHPNVPSPPAPFFTQIPYQNGQMQGQWHPRASGDDQFHQSYDAEGVIPYPTQSAPTHVLYERARQAASSTKSSQQPTPRKASSSTPAQRKPWTPDEENALMAGLDRVKGPHWSQIHAMFGPNGTINDVLKDRNQVQLKDKARNLKLFFLKSNIEVPYYLQFVTGELKTRAPSRVAKNEARQKAMSEEDRAHVQGVMTLAGTAGVGEGGLDDEDGGETEQQHMLRLAVSATSDVNIDPALEAQLRQAAADEDTNHAITGGRYTVPTPNMLMQNIEKFIGGSNSADSSKR